MKATIQLFGVFLLAWAIISGCAANKQEANDQGQAAEGDDIENLFGISEGGEKSSAAPQDDEAEVLRLLGITKTENEGAQVTEQPAGDAMAENNLQGEISDLEQQLLNKEAEIANLKSDIASKDQRINELESNISSSSNVASSTPVNVTGDFLQDYQSGLAAYQNRDYKQAIAIFEDLLSRGENNSYVDNCQYWIGESYYGLSNYNQAVVEFTKVFAFAKSNKSDDAQLKLGLCYWKLGDMDKAREEFQRLMSDYPQSEYIQKAEQFMSRL